LVEKERLTVNRFLNGLTKEGHSMVQCNLQIFRKRFSLMSI
jgi:hypothetical protein